MKTKEEKTKFLKGYRVFFVKIDRLKEMCDMFPENVSDYKKEISRTNKIIEKIDTAIKNVDDGILSEILFQKYILGRSLESISFELNYSKRQIERLHNIAIEKLEIF
ncbi:MAG: hypothetical protein MJ090_03605 [Clostridia bacterium]|nr:hypothetical protein [Clostridia bacterium]